VGVLEVREEIEEGGGEEEKEGLDLS